MTTEFLDNLVVVVANHSVLRVKRRKLGVVFHQCLVLAQHLDVYKRQVMNTALQNAGSKWRYELNGALPTLRKQ